MQRELIAPRLRGVGVGLLLVAAWLTVTGCDRRPATANATAPGSPGVPSPADALGDGTQHVHAAPHGGTLVECAEEAVHVELVLDRAAGRLTLYGLGTHADTPARSPDLTIKATVDAGDGPFDVSLDAIGSPLTGEKPGDTSEFVVHDKRLCGDAEIRGTLHHITLRGATFEDVIFSIPR